MKVKLEVKCQIWLQNRFRIVSVTRPSITEPLEEALRFVLSMMAENATESWTTSELYAMYVAASGTASRRQFMSNATAHFGDELLVLHIEGCDSVVGFKASLGKVIKIVKISQSMGDDDELEKLVRKPGMWTANSVTMFIIR